MLDVAFLMLNITGMLIGYGHNFIEVMSQNGTIMILRTPQAMQIASQVPLGQNVTVMVNGTKLMLEYRYRYRHKYMVNATVTQVEKMVGNRTVCVTCEEMREMHKYQQRHMYNTTETYGVTEGMHGEMHETMTTRTHERVTERTTTPITSQGAHGEEHRREHG